MKNTASLIGLLLTFSLLSALGIRAAEPIVFEQSQPYLTLTAIPENLDPGERIVFTIEYGNLGPDPAENVTITLNQPMDGRSPLIFLSAVPEPDKWISSEYGNLAEFSQKILEPDEATSSGSIEIVAQVREAAASQQLQATASLEAPLRELGKRLVTSNASSITIGNEADIGDDGPAGSDRQAGGKDATVSAFSVTPGPTPEATADPLLGKVLSSEAIGTTAAFLVIAALLAVAYFAGRRSKS